MIRWPGGNWGDENSVTEWMVDEYIGLCRAVGAEPCIHVRLFGGTPSEAANLVKYVNVTKQYAVKFWAIGNEPDLFVKKRGAKRYNVADYATDFVTYRQAMKQVDATIIVMGPEISQFDADEQYPVDATGEPWLRGFLQRVTDIEMVSWHRYPFGGAPVSRTRVRLCVSISVVMCRLPLQRLIRIGAVELIVTQVPIRTPTRYGGAM
jgi:alpha-L-arabinofuranosidase